MSNHRSNFQRSASDGSGSGRSEPLAARPLNILIVEDDAETQRMMKIILARSGHNLVFCSNGNEAVQNVKSQSFDLVFMDVQMPLMDGLEATRQIRKWEDGRGHLPIVGITAIFDSQHRNCFQAGMDDLISKPFDTAQIYHTIAACVKQEGLYAILGSTADKSLTDELAILDIKGAIKRFAGDQEVYRELLDEFLLVLPDKYEDLIKDFRKGDWDALSNHAHNLKGLSASMGAMRLSRNALRLERLVNEARYDEAKEVLRKIDTAIQGLLARGSGL